MVFRNFFLVLLLILSGLHFSEAQITSSARNIGMGEAGIAMGGMLNDLLGNPAGIGFLNRPAVLLGHRYLFHQPDVRIQVLQLAFPIKKHSIALSLNHLTLEQAYSDVTVGIWYAKRFAPNFSMGFGLLRQQIYIPGYFDQERYSLYLGTQYRLSASLALGLKLEQVKIAGDSKPSTDPYGYRFGAGFQYLFSRQLGVVFDLLHGPDWGTSLHSGLEYYPVPGYFSLRMGMSGKDLMPTAGFGIYWNNFGLDVGSSFHPRLGMSPQIDLSYAF